MQSRKISLGELFEVVEEYACASYESIILAAATCHGERELERLNGKNRWRCDSCRPSCCRNSNLRRTNFTLAVTGALCGPRCGKLNDIAWSNVTGVITSSQMINPLCSAGDDDAGKAGVNRAESWQRRELIAG